MVVRLIPPIGRLRPMHIDFLPREGEYWEPAVYISLTLKDDPNAYKLAAILQYFLPRLEYDETPDMRIRLPETDDKLIHAHCMSAAFMIKDILNYHRLYNVFIAQLIPNSKSHHIVTAVRMDQKWYVINFPSSPADFENEPPDAGIGILALEDLKRIPAIGWVPISGEMIGVDGECLRPIMDEILKHPKLGVLLYFYHRPVKENGFFSVFSPFSSKKGDIKVLKIWGYHTEGPPHLYFSISIPHGSIDRAFMRELNDIYEFNRLLHTAGVDAAVAFLEERRRVYNLAP